MLEPMTDSEREPLLPPPAPAAPPAAAPVTLTLAFKPPYDWNALIGFLEPRAIPGVECVRSGAYLRTIALGGARGWLSVRPAESAAALLATIQFPHPAALPLIAGRIRHLFDLDADPALIAEKLSADPMMARLAAARPGLRVPGAWDAFELAVRAILGQQVSVARATILAGKLVALSGTALPRASAAPFDVLTHLFPRPGAVAAIADPKTPPGVAMGVALGMPRARAASITALAQAVGADPDLLAPAETLDRSVARLRALPGIGEWTAQYIAMRALHWSDAFPHSDIGLIRALQTGERRPTPEEVLARAHAWRPWRAYAALHLWFSDSATARLTGPERGNAG
ncbi:MAG: DNA-3-methyladenine glycosylase family protein [Acetobacteraceae bacterium]